MILMLKEIIILASSFETPFNNIQKAIKMDKNKIVILYVDDRKKWNINYKN